MSAIDKLREFCADINMDEINDHIEPFCDEVDGVGIATFGIDTEWVDGWHRAVDKIIGDIERGYIELPKDMDGVPICVGDVMDGIVAGEPCVRDVEAIGVESFFAWSDLDKHWHQYDASLFTHYCKPTVEDVLREMMGEMGECYAEDVLLAKYAPKLREAMRND